MKNRDDFELEPATTPKTIKEIVLDELYSDTAHKEGKTYPKPESIDELLQRVYRRIEQGALEAYKSNELWAIKAYCYDTILTDAVAKEACLTDEALLEELASPVQEWQAENFDPLLNFKHKMEASEYSPGYISICMNVAREFVLRYGKKQRYSEPEILDFLNNLRNRCYNETTKTYNSTYPTKVYQLKVFLDSLPEDKFGRKQKMPLKRFPKYPSEYYEPTFTQEELESMAAAAIIDEKPQSILRLLLAQIYGLRLGELVTIDSKYINLNHGEPTITFLVQKRRTAKRVPVTQPIPKELTPYFSVPISTRDPHQIISDLKRICKKAGVKIPFRAGIHAIRRRVVTDLWSMPDMKELSIRRFIRWSTGSMGVMPRYVQKPTELTDMEILQKHPYSWWKVWASYVSWLPQYQPYTSVHIIDNR